MPQPVASPSALGDDCLAGGYQLKIHLLGISPQTSRRVLVRGDATLAELHHIFQVMLGWENWHLHCFHRWGKDYGLSYAGGTWYADDARRGHLGDFAWWVNDKFTYTYDFGDYWQHQVRVEKVLPLTAMLASLICLSGCRVCPPEEVSGPSSYDQRTLDQFNWRYGTLLLVQARTKVLNEEGEDCFRRQYPGFRPLPTAPLPIAA